MATAKKAEKKEKPYEYDDSDNRLDKSSYGKWLKLRGQARDTVKAMLAMGSNSNQPWSEVFVAIPPASVLQKVIGTFDQTTDIPLELPFFVTLHYLSAYLLQKGITIDFEGQTIRPDIWTVLLAPSGAGKTFTQSAVKDFFGDEVEFFPDSASAAKFIEELRDHNKAFWCRDEYAQLLDGIDKQTHMAEMKDYLLRTYDGEKIERRTKKEDIVVEQPALTILGTTVDSTFAKYVTPEMMLDGFAQRFAYAVAKPDPDKIVPVYTTRKHQEIKEEIRKSWAITVASVKHDNYKVSQLGLHAFKESFHFLMRDGGVEIPMSFFRRILFRGIKYALLYHVILKKDSDELDDIDFGWAGRVCALHLRDVRDLIREHGYGELERKLQKVEALKEKYKAKGKTLTPREVVQGVWGVKTVKEAQDLMAFVANK